MINSKGRQPYFVSISIFFVLALLLTAFTHSQNIEQYKNSIVFLHVEGINPNSGAVGEAQATGFILCESGYVLTAKHTTNNLKDKGYTKNITISGSIKTGEEISKRKLEIIREDESDDLLLLKFRGEAPTNIIPVVLSEGLEPATGTELYSLGFPSLNAADLTYKDGVMSGNAPQGHWFVDMALNRGDSGSPVFNSSGQVVAVVRGGFKEFEGLKEVVPVSFVDRLLVGVPCEVESKALADNASNGQPSAQVNNIDNNTGIGSIGNITGETINLTINPPNTSQENPSENKNNSNGDDERPEPNFPIISLSFLVVIFALTIIFILVRFGRKSNPSSPRKESRMPDQNTSNDNTVILKDRKGLTEALFSAFPSEAKLTQMLKLELDKDLEAITKSDSVKNMIFNVIKDAEADGWLKDLVKAARAHNPGNLSLKQDFFEEIPK